MKKSTNIHLQKDKSLIFLAVVIVGKTNLQRKVLIWDYFWLQPPDKRSLALLVLDREYIAQFVLDREQIALLVLDLEEYLINIVNYTKYFCKCCQYTNNF